MKTLLAPTLPRAACINRKPTKALCLRCFNRPECLTWGLEHDEPGLWGGHDTAERNKLRDQFGITPQPAGGA
jgi:hypothetical protein